MPAHLTTSGETQPPPAHLSDEMADFWRYTVASFELEAAHLLVLRAACENFDRAEQARRQVDEDGPTTLDRYGSPKPHPCLTVERDARAAALRALRQLDLEGIPDPLYRRR